MKQLRYRLHRVFEILETRLMHASGQLTGVPRLRFYCPVCAKLVHRWLPFYRSAGDGLVSRERGGRLCPHCRSFERTRHFALYLEQTGRLDESTRMLHIAPEKGLVPRLREKLSSNYVTTDLFMPGVDRREDITKMTFERGAFDFVYCSNVLEHVEDDRSAMAELYRVLCPGGAALIQVPLRGSKTYEDWSITDPKRRFEEFGQSDHVRFYGEDIQERLSQAGFDVTPFYMLDILQVDIQAIRRMNLDKRELLFECSRPKSSALE